MSVTIDSHNIVSLELSNRGKEGVRIALEDKIQSCNRCSLCELSFNKLDIQKGYGKLLGWQGGAKDVKYFFVGLNPSYNRFANLKYAFGGADFNEGTGVEFVKILKDIGIIENSYVTNIVKCSSSNNNVDENIIKQCVRFLKVELMLYKPEVLITLGKKVDEYFNDNGNIVPAGVKYVNIWHPNYPITYKRELLNDYAKIIKEATIG